MDEFVFITNIRRPIDFLRSQNFPYLIICVIEACMGNLKGVNKSELFTDFLIYFASLNSCWKKRIFQVHQKYLCYASRILVSLNFITFTKKYVSITNKCFVIDLSFLKFKYWNLNIYCILQNVLLITSYFLLEKHWERQKKKLFKKSLRQLTHGGWFKEL